MELLGEDRGGDPSPRPGMRERGREEIGQQSAVGKNQESESKGSGGKGSLDWEI